MIDTETFRIKLINWWRDCGRDFPWRRTSDPYKLLIVETLLHRTRADQVVPVYLKFIREFPDIKVLAEAPREKVMNLLHPLGLKWRAKLLHDMAVEIVRRNSKIAPDRNILRSLPGVSDYIASAVLCFAYGKPEPLLDTNTVRITGRIFNIRVSDGSRRSKKFRELYLQLMDKNRPREFNMAMIDLGALICKPRYPLCEECPVREKCCYYLESLSREEERSHA